MKKTICFIINPISGVGSKKVIEPLIDQHLNPMFEYWIVYTSAPKSATQLAKRAVADNFNMVVAVGGDGSINEIGRGLIGSNTSMAIIPAGSGNGLARHLNIPLNFKKAIEVINNGKEKRIDTIRLNEEIFFNVAGIGFDALIGEKIAKLSKRDFASYFKLITQEFFKYHDQDFEIIIDGKTVHKKAFLISFANGSQWGYNTYISPAADITDGIIDITILKNVSFFNAFFILYQLLRKTIHRSSCVEIIKTNELIIKQLANIAHIDGEPIDVGNTISIKVDPLSLSVIVP